MTDATSELVLCSSSAAETRRIGQALGEAAAPNDVFLLEGAFGAGKTVFVQGLAAGLGVQDEIASPSFVLMVEHQGRLRLYHFDLYRLDGRLDAEMLETLADARDAGGVCAVEWPDALPPDLAAGATVVTIVAPDDATREIAIQSSSARLLDAAGAAAAENA